jgi:murein L,D-transpeptidase YcbB/YkuD
MTLRNRKYIGALALGGVVTAGALALVLSQTPHKADFAPVAPQAAAPTREAPASAADAATPLQEAISNVAQPGLRADLEKLYAESEYRPLWTDNKAGRRRLEAVENISRTLDMQGLDSSFLTSAKTKVLGATTKEERLQAELAMSAAILRAAYGQRLGFVSSKTLGWNLEADTAEIAAFVGEAAAKGRLAEHFTTLQPPHPQFKALTEALATYRQIAASGGWPAIPSEKEIDFGGDTRLPALRDRLAAEGYLSPNADDAALLEAVKLFQSRNGLTPDGRAGKGTLAALNVPVEQRIDQIVANLERWRHVRHQEPEAYVVANIADQTVAVIRNGNEDLRLRTVVGSRKHATPILEAKLTAVTLNPPWEIPTSIITNEIIPKLDIEPYYLEDNGMHVVSGNWDNPKSLRIRQAPGAGNSLGHMKFQMQNEWNIYLHDTPSRALFAKDERTFSHGCVRVQDPQELAANLLSGMSVEDLNDGIASGETRTIKLEKALPVFVMYWSVFTDKDGHLNFRRDVYDRDSETAAALSDAGVLLPASQVVVTGN